MLEPKKLSAVPAPPDLTGDQVTIWDTFEKLKIGCVQKNIDYGSSFMKKPIFNKNMKPSEAVLVRIHDKIQRIQTLLESTSGPLVKDESIDDTFRDLGTYCFLYLIAKESEQKDKQKLVRNTNGFNFEELIK